LGARVGRVQKRNVQARACGSAAAVARVGKTGGNGRGTLDVTGRGHVLEVPTRSAIGTWGVKARADGGTRGSGEVARARTRERAIDIGRAHPAITTRRVAARVHGKLATRTLPSGATGAVEAGNHSPRAAGRAIVVETSPSLREQCGRSGVRRDVTAAAKSRAAA
jgi:hypothetical protein